MHEIHATELDPVPEWSKINTFIKGIKCTQLQYDCSDIEDDAIYQHFTVLYNKMNENYRMLIDQKIIKPVSISRSKINHMNCRNYCNNGGQGGHGRG